MIDDRLYVVTRFIDGEQLQQRPYSIDLVIKVGIELGGAISYAHQSGFVHRDIKPSNILLTPSGNAVLVDFGVSTVVDSGEHKPFTLDWAAPEVLLDEPYGTAADAYSFSATLWTLLTGHAPFSSPGEGYTSTLMKVLHAPVPPVDRPDVPESLQILLNMGLSKDPRSRPRLDDLVSTLRMIDEKLAASGGSQAQNDAPTSGRLVEHAPYSVVPPTNQPTREGRRRRPSNDRLDWLLGWLSSWDWPGLLPISLGSLSTDRATLESDNREAADSVII